MAVTIDSIQDICSKITEDVVAAYDGLSLQFIVHTSGRMREAIAWCAPDILAHPAGKSCEAILKKHSSALRSKFLGMSIYRQSLMFGLRKQDHILALFAVNADTYENLTEVRAHIYHLVWHAIDLYELRLDPNYARKFKSGPIVPKRSPLNLSKANLQADVYAGIMSILEEEDYDSSLLKMIAKKRGVMSLQSIADYKAEDFPSAIAIQSCEFIIQELTKKNVPKDQKLKVAREISIDVGRAYNSNNIQQWWDFSIPAQDMAWRGFKKEDILGAAVNTSTNPYVRSIGYLIQEITDIQPRSATTLKHTYNAFLDPAITRKLHREMVDSAFENALSESEQSDGDTGRALLNAANKQNADLTEGRILGWCANALQEAARAFERALTVGTPAVQAARMQFEGTKQVSSWDDLKDLGDKIVEERRKGFAVTLGHVAEVCHNHPGFTPVLSALRITMNDPAYIRQLEAANDLAIMPRAPQPSTPVPQTPTPQAPSLSPHIPAPSGPALGGKPNPQIAHQRYLQSLKKDSDNKSSENPTE